MGEWITIKQFYYQHETFLYESKLRSENIDCFMKDGAIVSIDPFLSNAVGGIKLQVQPENVEKAKAIIDEMAERIARHQLERDGRWQVIEEPLQLAKVLKEHGKADRCILVDCLTLWLSNCLCQHGEAYWLEQKAALLDVLKELPCEVIFVSNEVGHGIVPLGELSREFVDHSGWLHQSLAKQVARVEFIIAGLAQTLKREQ